MRIFMHKCLTLKFITFNFYEYVYEQNGSAHDPLDAAVAGWPNIKSELVENNVKDNSSESKSTSKDQNNPECISILLEFIHYLMEHDIEALIHLYPKINKLAIDWVNSERVSFQALAVLTKVVQKATEAEDDNNNRELLQMSVAALPAFMLIFPSNVMPCNMESCRRLVAWLQLFRVMLQSSSIRPNVLQVLKKDMVRKVFSPLESDNLNVEWLPNFKSRNGNMTSTDAVNTYLYGLRLINELVQYDASWLDLQSTLMENRKIHMIIAQALYGGTSDVRCVALEICRHGSLPIKKVASAMGTLQPLFTSDFDASSTTSLNKAHYSVLHMGISTLSFGQMGRLEDILHQIKRLIDENKLGNITTSQVMELYEYKLATSAYAEWSFLSSIKAATERCTQLQHRLAEITVEQNKFQQQLFHSEQCLEQTVKSKEELRAMYEHEQNQNLGAKEQIKMLESQLKNEEKASAEFQNQPEERNRQVENMSKTIVKLKEQMVAKEKFINELVESSNKSEKNLLKSEELLKKSDLDNKNLNAQIAKLQEEKK